MTAHQIRAREFTPEAPTRDPKYLAFLRRQSCAVCPSTGSGWNPIEAAHTGNRGRATGQKSDDHDAIPLCATDHVLYHEFDREADWAAKYNIDLPALRERYLARYREANRLPGDCVEACGE